MNRGLVGFMIAVLLAGCNMSGCSLLNTEPFVDAKKDAQGNVTLLDTPRMWQDFTEVTDMQIRSEQTMKKPPGVVTWNEHWLLRIKNNRDRGHPQKYIDYIIQRRQEAWLPSLVGYP